MDIEKTSQMIQQMVDPAILEGATEQIVEEYDKFKKKYYDATKKHQKKESSIVSRLLSSEYKDVQDAKTDLVQKNIKDQAKILNQKKSPALEKQLEKQLNKFFSGDLDHSDHIQLSARAYDATKGTHQKPASDKKESAGHDDAIISNETVEDTSGLLGTLSGLVSRKQKKDLTSRLKETSQKYQQSQKKEVVQDRAVKNFTSALTGFIYTKDPKRKQEMEHIKDQLLKSGITKQQVSSMETSVSTMVKQHYMFELKKNLLKHFFSKTDKERGVSPRKILTEYEFSNQRDHLHQLKDQGIIKGNFHGVMESMGDNVRRDIESLLYHETNDSFVKVQLGQKTLDQYTNELWRLQKAAAAAGVIVNEPELTENIYRTIEELGLEQFIPPVGSSTMSFSDQSRENESPYDPEDLYINQQERLEDQLRNLYMMKALKPSLKSNMEITFKMKKLRNGLIKLGISIQEREEALQNEGVFLAQMKTLGQLQDNFREQATLPALSGPDYDIIKKKRVFLIKVLRRLGYKVNTVVLKKIQDDMNRDMYPFIREELHQAEMMFEIRKTAPTGHRCKMYSKILERLREESNISDNLMPSFKTYVYQQTINEAA